jgi:hypothetical protein
LVVLPVVPYTACVIVNPAPAWLAPHVRVPPHFEESEYTDTVTDGPNRLSDGPPISMLLSEPFDSCVPDLTEVVGPFDSTSVSEQVSRSTVPVTSLTVVAPGAVIVFV